MACDFNSAASRATIVRKEINRGSGADPRNRAYAFEQSSCKGGSLRGLPVLRDRQRYGAAQHIFGVESGAGAL